MKHYMRHILPAAAFAAMALAPGAAQALTVTIDGVTSPTVLSDAVDTCMSAGAGPHVINITTDTLATPDRQVVITQPITINGDADNNTTACDILVDMTGIVSGADAGVQAYKSYIEVQAAGLVAINNLNIHPNDDGSYAAYGTGGVNSAAKNVSGIRFFKPVQAGDTGTYNLTNVGVSGSDSNNNYLSLGTANDLFNLAGRKRWGGLSPDDANEVNHVKHAALHYSNDAVGAGFIVSKLDHCELGLSRGCAVSITASNTTVEVLGGIFGHSARDGVRIADGANVTVKGTSTDRVRVVRAANIPKTNAHSVEVVGGATVPLIEYVDVAGESTANGFAFRDGTVNVVNSVRVLGKFDETDPTNHGLYIGSANMTVGLVKNSTIHGDGEPEGAPMGMVAGVTSPVEFRDTIFTSRFTTESLTVASPTLGVATFNNCCLTSDGLVGESMTDPPITGAGATTPGAVITNNCIYSSPVYQYTLANYDWSDKQGAGTPVGAGNNNVLRPTNLAYLTASSTGGPLTGGAGPALAGISPNEWMLLED